MWRRQWIRCNRFDKVTSGQCLWRCSQANSIFFRTIVREFMWCATKFWRFFFVWLVVDENATLLWTKLCRKNCSSFGAEAIFFNGFDSLINNYFAFFITYFIVATRNCKPVKRALFENRKAVFGKQVFGILFFSWFSCSFNRFSMVGHNLRNFLETIWATVR